MQEVKSLSEQSHKWGSSVGHIQTKLLLLKQTVINKSIENCHIKALEIYNYLLLNRRTRPKFILSDSSLSAEVIFASPWLFIRRVVIVSARVGFTLLLSFPTSSYVSRMAHVDSLEGFLNSVITHSDVRSSAPNHCSISEKIHRNFLEYWHVKSMGKSM